MSPDLGCECNCTTAATPTRSAANTIFFTEVPYCCRFSSRVRREPRGKPPRCASLRSKTRKWVPALSQHSTCGEFLLDRHGFELDEPRQTPFGWKAPFAFD